MKTFNLEVKGASQAQLITLKAELETMSKSWKRFGANIKVKSAKLQAPSYKPRGSGYTRWGQLDKSSKIIQDKNMKDIKKKLIKKVKRSRPSLAKEIKEMPMKDFRALWFVVQQGLKVKKENKLN